MFDYFLGLFFNKSNIFYLYSQILFRIIDDKTIIFYKRIYFALKSLVILRKYPNFVNIYL